MQKVKKIAILFSGNGSNMENLIKELHQKSFMLEGVGGSEARENQANKDDRAGTNGVRGKDEMRGKDTGDIEILAARDAIGVFLVANASSDF